MSLVDIWIHAVWGTKNRLPVLEKNIRKMVCDHIKEQAKVKGIFIDTIDGHLDHLHCLATLHAVPLSKQMQLIKGENSYWINKNKIINAFDWADKYFAVSVSERQLDTVRAYINNQEEHHRKVSFEEEYNILLKEFGLSQTATAKAVFKG